MRSGFQQIANRIAIRYSARLGYSIAFKLYSTHSIVSRHLVAHKLFNKRFIESLDSLHVLLTLNICSFIWKLVAFTLIYLLFSFPYVQTRFGLLEDTDRELFFIVCYNFYNEVFQYIHFQWLYFNSNFIKSFVLKLKNDQNREAFRTTFQSIAEIDSPYSEVLRYLQIQKSWNEK